tara:strand:+ start:512 stop:790 length:279 start_codon:yes stop_codon:yes gene_type:complete
MTTRSGPTRPRDRRKLPVAARVAELADAIGLEIRSATTGMQRIDKDVWTTCQTAGPQIEPNFEIHRSGCVEQLSNMFSIASRGGERRFMGWV